VRVAIVGATSQLGRALLPLLGDRVVWSGGRSELDISDREAVHSVIAQTRPEIIINLAAFNDVDGAERRIGEAFAVNASGPRHIVEASRREGALVVHVSTDYVFDGTKKRPYTEEDCPSPINAYGVSKLAGEQMVTSAGVPYILVRTSGLYGSGGNRMKGGSFVERILEKARAGRPLKVVADQIFSPTYAPDLAAAMVSLLEGKGRGCFHITNSGSCSWHGLAVATLRLAGLSPEVEESRSELEPGRARRPAYSVLSNARYLSMGFPILKPWNEALAEHLQ